MMQSYWPYFTLSKRISQHFPRKNLCSYFIDCRHRRHVFDTDLTSTGGAAVNLPILPLLVHASILHTPDPPVSVKIIDIITAATAPVVTAPVVVDAVFVAVVVAGPVAVAADVTTADVPLSAFDQLSQRYPHLLIFF